MIEISTQQKFEKIYAKYSSLLYGIAINIAPNEVFAKEVFAETFKEIYLQINAKSNFDSSCMLLIKIIIKVGHKVLNNEVGKTNFKLNLFENSPVLQNLICEQMSFGNHCIENELVEEIAAKKIRAEVMTIRYLQAKKRFAYS